MGRQRRTPRASRLVVFLGPTLDLIAARSLLPQAEFRPPVRRGDLEELSADTVVGIIDGVFDQDLAVSPREIAQALARGVRIAGSSSMGALRAAEVPGVVGIGRVFELFRDGRIEDDDEVALLFDPETYRTVTEPLVNVRYAAERLVSAGTISAAVGKRIVEAAAGLHYRERAYVAILRAAGLEGRADVAQLASLLKTFNLKREDAHLLLERLPSLPLHAAPPAVRARREPPAPREMARPASPAPDAPLLLWEVGDTVPFDELLLFLKMTNRFLPHALRALGRFALEGNTLDVPAAAPAVPTAQELFDQGQFEWGWTTPEEVHASLADVGLDLADLGARLEEESAARRALHAVVQSSDPELHRALRAELWMNGLALKREVLRAGSLVALANLAGGDGQPTVHERRDAERTICRLFGEVRWAAVLSRLAEVGVSDGQTGAFVVQLALARRAAAPTTRALDGRLIGASKGRPALRLDGKPLRSSPKAPGDPRFAETGARAERIVGKIASRIGITRVGLIGGLDDLPFQIGQAFRPSSPWSTTVGSGKGETRAGAKIGSVMEEVEKFGQEQFVARKTRVASYTALSRRADVVDPRALDLPHDSAYHPALELEWLACDDLVSGKPWWIPSSTFTIQRQKNDIFYSPRGARKVMNSNGMGSGFRLEEALVHAVSELIERHATRLAELSLDNPGGVGRPDFRFIDLDSLPPANRRIVDKIRGADYVCRILDITSEVAVPTFHARIFRDPLHETELEPYSEGWGTHPNPQVAVSMALLEAVQTKLGNVAGAREDLTVTARSLGRHERARPNLGSSLAFWQQAGGATKPLAVVSGLVSRNHLAELRWLIERLRDAGLHQVLAVDFSAPEFAPARAVRAVIPGLESVNPFFTGLRARVTALWDLVS